MHLIIGRNMAVHLFNSLPFVTSFTTTNTMNNDNFYNKQYSSLC